MESLAKTSKFGSKHVGRLACSSEKAVATTAAQAKEGTETSTEMAETLDLFWEGNNVGWKRVRR